MYFVSFLQFVIYIATEEEEGLYNLYFHSCPNYGYPKSPVYLDFTVSLRTILLSLWVNHKHSELHIVALLFPHTQSCQDERPSWVATPWVLRYSSTILTTPAQNSFLTRIMFFSIYLFNWVNKESAVKIAHHCTHS